MRNILVDMKSGMNTMNGIIKSMWKTLVEKKNGMSMMKMEI